MGSSGASPVALYLRYRLVAPLALLAVVGAGEVLVRARDERRRRGSPDSRIDDRRPKPFRAHDT